MSVKATKETKTMSTQKTASRRYLGICGALLTLCAWLIPTTTASAAAPAWSLSAKQIGSFIPGSLGDPTEGPGYQLVAKNEGELPTSDTYTIKATLPSELTPAAGISGEDEAHNPLSCQSTGQTVTCTGSAALNPSQTVTVTIPVDVEPGTSGKSVFGEATVEGGNAAPASITLAAALGAPAWQLSATPLPSNFAPGSSDSRILFIATNVGGAPTSGPIEFTATLPEGLTPTSGGDIVRSPGAGSGSCSISGQVFSCNEPGPIQAGRHIELTVRVSVSPLASGPRLIESVISGGGSPASAETVSTTISPVPPPYGFLAGATGFSAPLTDADGATTTQAGSHPFQLTVNLGFPTVMTNGNLAAAGHLRDGGTDLPRGEIVNPQATPVLCTEAQLISEASPGCPVGSQIGIASVVTVVGGPILYRSPLYNLVAPPGSASNFGFDAVGVGIFAHILGSVRSDGDYGVSGDATDTLAFPLNPVFGVKIELWGDPSSPAHDPVRGHCVFSDVPCSKSVAPGDTAFLTATTECSGQPILTKGRTRSWEEPNSIKTASYESADLAGEPISISGCNQVPFESTIEVKPTTPLADSPSGLDVTVHTPEDESPAGISAAPMRDITLTLPEGMSANPSSADGLGACSEAQSNFHTRLPTNCPDAAKLGTVEAVSPALDHPISGFLYFAKPYHNPFGSLLALYLTIHDPATGLVFNLPGKVLADPVTGQLRSVFDQNPQLPLEDLRVHLFTGPRAALRTPPACGTYTPSARLTPWSSPEGADVTATDSFAIQAAPGGIACPTSTDALQNSPSVLAGTLAPQAGAYSPFVFKASREDDTQPPQKIEAIAPPGLTGKLAGIPTCSEAQIAQAIKREKPEQGIVEQANPSCPASSEVGTVDVASGAGITPLHVQGHVYLAGPYKGAPLSLAVITPAVAGPLDLGAVVARTALYVDPETAQIRAVSDPLPSIIEGIPLDIRSIYLKLGRPNFTLNPTSCDPMSVASNLTSTFGQIASLSSPFQVGGCSELPFKPKLALKLKGSSSRAGHPALTAIASFKAGGANAKRISVALPHTEFLDQGHIQTICTRVQFAADQCPKRSVYGQATAITPLLDEPLTGPAYLRSSDHELPDLVLALHGPPNKPIEVDAVGRIDSINGGIRTSFEAIPDAPVSKVILKMQGGRKGLLVNSANLCAQSPDKTRATVKSEAQNGKVFDFGSQLEAECKKAKRHRHHR